MFNIKSKKADKVGYDRTILITSILLLCVSIILIFSASINESQVHTGDMFFYLKRQVLNILVALFFGFIALSINTKIWEKYSLYFMFFTILLLVLVLIVGREINHAKRWLELGVFNFQPGEMLKFFWGIYFSDYINRKIDAVRFTKSGFWKPMIFLGVFSLLLLLQPDFGTLVVVAIMTFGLLWAAGAGLIKFLVTLFAFAIALSIAAITQPYRVARLMTFLDPWADVFDTGYQLTLSLMAFGRGGLFGEGMGNSLIKLQYLPEAHTDFVSSILGEEFGFIGLLVVLLLELILVYKAFSLSFRILRMGNFFQGYVAFSIGTVLAVQTFINLAMSSGMAPTKGLTLPLISYGGSSLIFSLMFVAILLRIDFEWRHKVIGFKVND